MRQPILATLAALAVALSGHAAPPEPTPSAETVTVHRDERGEPYLALYGLTLAEQDAILTQIGADPARSPSIGSFSSESSDNEGHGYTWETLHYRFDFREWPSKRTAARLQAGEEIPLHPLPGRKRLAFEVAGISASATWSQLEEGPLSYAVEDSFGGRVEYRDTLNGPKWVKDSDGLILGVSYDDLGRAIRLFIGFDYVLETTYSDSREDPALWDWTERKLTDADGRILQVWKWSELALAPRPGAKLFSDGFAITTGVGPVVTEWDKELYPEGVVLVPARRVSVLAPLTGKGQVWRSVELPQQRGTMANGDSVGRPNSIGRLDFTDKEFRLWMSLSHQAETPGRLATVGASAVITLPRLKATPERAEAFRKRGPF